MISSNLLGQHGTAPPGRYPLAYTGDTFSGKVVSRNLDADTVTLEFRKGNKNSGLEVRLEGGCRVPSKTGEPMHAKSVPEGTVLTAFYMPKTEVVGGEKKKLYVAIGISFLEWQGKRILDKDRVVYPCGDQGYVQYQYW
jgi:hypothetical protein